MDKCVPAAAPVAAVFSFSVSILMASFGSLGKCSCGVVGVAVDVFHIEILYIEMLCLGVVAVKGKKARLGQAVSDPDV